MTGDECNGTVHTPLVTHLLLVLVYGVVLVAWLFFGGGGRIKASQLARQGKTKLDLN